MKKIFEYVIKVTDASEILLPAGAKILSVMEQDRGIVLYALVNTDVTVQKRISIRVVGTGHDIAFDVRDFTFLGTVSLHDGKLMFHVFYHDHGYTGES